MTGWIELHCATPALSKLEKTAILGVYFGRAQASPFHFEAYVKILLPGDSAAILQKCNQNSAKNLEDIDSKPLPLLIFPQKLDPEAKYLAQGVLETSSFHCIVQHIFLILKCSFLLI